MKTLLIISLLLFKLVALGQSANTRQLGNTNEIKRYIVGDLIIECHDCISDFCGNLINIKGDTIAHNTRPLDSFSQPIYLTNNNILLSAKTAKELADHKKIRSLSVINCKEGRQIFGNLAKNGIVIVELTNQSSVTDLLEQRLEKLLNIKIEDVSSVYVNGLLLTGINFRVLKSDTLKVDFDKVLKSINVRTQ